MRAIVTSRNQRVLMVAWCRGGGVEIQRRVVNVEFEGCSGLENVAESLKKYVKRETNSV